MHFLRVIGLAAIGGLFLYQAHALRVTINTNQPFVYIQVGHGDMNTFGLFGAPAGLVDEVSFSFPANVRPGDGTAISGVPVIPVMLIGLGNGNQANFSVTIDSSAPLINANGDTIPFSDFSWTTQDGDIPPGTFSGGPQQALMNFKGKKGNKGKGKGKGKGNQGTEAGVVDYLTFTFSNTNLYPAGVYRGRVVYTITNL